MSLGRGLLRAVGLSSLFACGGCLGCGGSQISAPYINARSAAAGAMREYDVDKNGALDEPELMKAPALKSSLGTMDQNTDGIITAAEISSRVQVIVGDEVGMLQFNCKVLFDGQPLADARVTATPEKWLGSQFRTATGTTDKSGRADLVMGLDGFPGMQCGLFKVEISKVVDGQETLPARYNKDTTLGLEVALDLPTTERGMVYKLTSKPQ